MDLHQRKIKHKVDNEINHDQKLPEEIQSSEKKPKKLKNRLIYGFLMLGLILTIIYAGHLYAMVFVMLLQAIVYRELVNVRYKAGIEKDIPHFRTLQWCWFLIAFLYAYGDFLKDFTARHKHLNWLHRPLRFFDLVSFLLYSLLFVATVLSLRQGFYKYQIQNLVWTIVTLCLILGQTKFVANNIYNGLFWFVYPAALVINNDVMAYACGMLFGKKFISSPFIKLSPNKTWEGFIGAFFLTIFFGFYGAKFLSQYYWMICPVDNFYFVPKTLTCVPHSVFITQELSLREIFTEFIWFLHPDQLTVLPDWNISIMPIQIHAIILAIFASLVAPFGGFAASAIKRAYSIKDFASFIPGHGGVMDRMDCQLIMSFCTWIYYKSLIAQDFLSVSEVMNSIYMLSPEEQQELYLQLKTLLSYNSHITEGQ